MNANEPETGVADSPTIVRTKLTPPIVPGGLLARPTVVAPLLTPHQLTLISAPAGWGKTSLIAGWQAADHQQRFAFVRLEADDNVPSVFWTYVIEALRALRPGLTPEADRMLLPPASDPAKELVPALVNDLAGGDEAMVLILDDYHVITDPAIHDSLVAFLDHLPPTVGLTISTRSDPPFPLGRLRASGALVEVRAGHLAFGVIETASFLRERFAIELDAMTARRLCDRTEGWPAGVQLAGISLQREADSVAFVDRFAGDDRNVADYLVGEVLSTLDTSRRRFLLRTSVLDELSGPLCDAVTGSEGSAATLEQLERDGLFVIPLDHQRSWYRYHHLLAEWLRHELRATDPELIPELHRRAAHWHEVNGSLASAIDHALATPDHDEAARLVEGHLGDWGDVQWSRMNRWLDHLPDDVILRHPNVALARSQLAFEAGEYGPALQWIEAAKAGLENLPDRLRGVMTTRLKMWLAVAQYVEGDMELALELAQEVVEEERSARSPYYAGAIGLVAFTTFWLVGALESIPLLIESSVAGDEHSMEDGGSIPLLALAYAEIGDWSAAETTAERALALPRPGEYRRFPVDVAALYAQGRVSLARGERTAARAKIAEGLALARDWVESRLIAYGCLLLAEASDDYVEKRALVREARQLVESAAQRGRVNDLVDAAERWLAMSHPDPTGDRPVEPLTDRERQVLRLLRSELSLREIAGELYLSHNTVKSYTKSIYRKLGVTSREAAVAAGSGLP